MDHVHTADPRAELLLVIRDVRRRWRLRVAAGGAVRFLGAMTATLLVEAYLLEALRFSAGAILASRAATVLAIAGFAAWFIARPLLRRATDEDVALYIEEHEPSLDLTLLSAMETRRGEDPGRSPALVRRLVEQAVVRCHDVGDGRRVDRDPTLRYARLAAAVIALAVAVFALGPAYLRHALSAIVAFSQGVEASAPYRIEVAPGDVTVAKGADQAFRAVISGFEASEAALIVTRGPARGGDRLPMLRGDDGAFEAVMFAVDGSLTYLVEAAGVRSPEYALTAVESPYAKQIDLEYRFPAHTGLAPRVVEDGGDIAALKGTRVQVTVTPTMMAPGGRLVVGEQRTIPLARQADGRLLGEIDVQESGFYRVELDDSQGRSLTASPEYAIDVLRDQPPGVTISKPGRDTAATPVEEFFVEARADDDFAVRELQIVYSINGGAERTVPLYRGARPLAEVTAGHTFHLEELGVQPGDVVAYYARAMDNDGVSGAKPATSDIYFLRVRPFGKDFRPALSQGGGGGGAGGGTGDVTGLSQQQKQIVAGTFNLQRDRQGLPAGEAKERFVVLTLSQARLREQVEGLVERMNSRLVAPDPSFQKIAELLPKAVEEMKAAEGGLTAQRTERALPPEQRALRWLQQAEEEYELQVQTSRDGGGGGGGGAPGSISEDLADLFEQDLDRLANQYETSQRASEQSADRQVDELAEKLRELARRQEQQLDRLRRALAGQGAAASGGSGQRALAEQAEEAARRLERLSREQNRPDLAAAARQMQQAADAMRRAAAGGDPGAAGQAAAAAERLREAQRQLERTQSGRAARDIQDAVRQAEEIAAEHAATAEAAARLGSSGPNRNQDARLLAERKDALEARVGALEQQLDRTAQDIAKEQRDASRRLQEAANGLRDDKVRDKIRFSKRLLAPNASAEMASQLEESVAGNLQALRDRLGRAASALGEPGQRAEDATDRARDLARGLDSLGQRIEERRRDESGSPSGRTGTNRNEAGAEPGGTEGAQGSGSRGDDRQAGGTRADGPEGRGDSAGPSRDGGGWGDRRPDRPLDADDVRQFRGEARRWMGEAQDLRRMMRDQGVDTADLDALIRRLRQLDDDRVYRDAAQIARLNADIVEGARRFEFDLRRLIAGEADRVLLSGADEVPGAFRALVEEYYRSLARTPGAVPGAPRP